MGLEKLYPVNSGGDCAAAADEGDDEEQEGQDGHQSHERRHDIGPGQVQSRRRRTVRSNTRRRVEQLRMDGSGARAGRSSCNTRPHRHRPCDSASGGQTESHCKFLKMLLPNHNLRLPREIGLRHSNTAPARSRTSVKRVLRWALTADLGCDCQFLLIPW